LTKNLMKISPYSARSWHRSENRQIQVVVVIVPELVDDLLHLLVL